MDLALLIALPLAFLVYLLHLVWSRQTLGLSQLTVLTAAIPVVVGLVTYGEYRHVTRFHARTHAKGPAALAWLLLAMWIGSTFIFVILLVRLLQVLRVM